MKSPGNALRLRTCWALVLPALLAGLLRQLISQAMTQEPVQSWLAAFTRPASDHDNGATFH